MGLWNLVYKKYGILSYVVRSRLKSIPNEAVKCNALAREEEVRRFLSQYIELVKSQHGRVLGSNREIHEAFQVHVRDRFANCPNLWVQEFRSYLNDFLRLRETEAASCEGVVTECEVRDALKLVRLSKLPGLMVYPWKCT